MNQAALVILVLAVLFMIARIRARRSRMSREEKTVGFKVTGNQVNAFLHPRMSRACLFDHGMQFGQGFRVKEGPALPHDEACRCRIDPFLFDSSEVFNGALRKNSRVLASIEGLDNTVAEAMIDRLRTVEGQTPLPGSDTEYLAVLNLDGLPGEWRSQLEEFSRERFTFLKENAKLDSSTEKTETSPKTSPTDT